MGVTTILLFFSSSCCIKAHIENTEVRLWSGKVVSRCRVLCGFVVGERERERETME